MRREVGRCAAVLLVAWSLLAPAAASAHDGVGASYKAQVGRYLVYVYDGYPNESGLVEYRMVVLSAEARLRHRQG